MNIKIHRKCEHKTDDKWMLMHVQQLNTPCNGCFLICIYIRCNLHTVMYSISHSIIWQFQQDRSDVSKWKIVERKHCVENKEIRTIKKTLSIYLERSPKTLLRSLVHNSKLIPWTHNAPGVILTFVIEQSSQDLIWFYKKNFVSNWYISI